MGIEKITLENFLPATNITGPKDFPPGHYKVYCLQHPLTLTDLNLPGLYAVTQFDQPVGSRKYMIVSLKRTLPPEFYIKDDGSYESRGIWPSEDDRPMGVSFRDD